MTNDSACDKPGRWLTAQEKVRVLARWRETKRQNAPESAGGRGYPDPDIIFWCDKINALPGIVTLQSCQGHPEGDGETGPGNLWLKMSRDVSRAFSARAFELAACVCVDRLEVIFQPWGEEVASVTFAGNERNLLPHSMGTILAFLTELTDACHGRR